MNETLLQQTTNLSSRILFFNEFFFFLSLSFALAYFFHRITGGSLSKEGQNHETALLCWLSHVCAALKRRIDNEIENGATDEDVCNQSTNQPKKYEKKKPKSREKKLKCHLFTYLTFVFIFHSRAGCALTITEYTTSA